MAKFKVGQAVVCIKAEDPKYNFLIGQVGEITHILGDDILATLLGIRHEYGVDFPLQRGQPCPGCGKVHDAPFAMYEFELKALEDPDKDEVTEEVQDLSRTQ